MDRAVAALVREWGVSETEARAAVAAVEVREARLGRELAQEWTWQPHPPRVIDLTEREARCDVR